MPSKIVYQTLETMKAYDRRKTFGSKAHVYDSISGHFTCRLRQKRKSQLVGKGVGIGRFTKKRGRVRATDEISVWRADSTAKKRSRVKAGIIFRPCDSLRMRHFSNWVLVQRRTNHPASSLMQPLAHSSSLCPRTPRHFYPEKWENAWKSVNFRLRRKADASAKFNKQRLWIIRIFMCQRRMHVHITGELIDWIR